MERLTAWEGVSTDGLPAAVLVRNERTFNENMAAALRKLARYEDMEEARERGDLGDGRSV